MIAAGSLIKKDPTRRKSVQEIPRVPADKMHEEEIDEDTFHVDPFHIKKAEDIHLVDIKIRAKKAKAFAEPDFDQMAEKVGSLSPELESMEVDSMFKRAERPSNPDVHYLFQMIINLRIRSKWIDKGHPMDGFAIGM